MLEKLWQKKKKRQKEKLEEKRKAGKQKVKHCAEKGKQRQGGSEG